MVIFALGEIHLGEGVLDVLCLLNRESKPPRRWSQSTARESKLEFRFLDPPFCRLELKCRRSELQDHRLDRPGDAVGLFAHPLEFTEDGVGAPPSQVGAVGAGSELAVLSLGATLSAVGSPGNRVGRRGSRLAPLEE